MEFSLRYLLPQVVESIRNPQSVAHQLMRMTYSRATRWELLALVLVVGVLIVQLTSMINGHTAATGASLPIVLGVVQALVVVVMIYATFFIGRMFGGTGTLDQTILLFAWIFFVLLCIQVVQVVLMVFAPTLGILLWMASLGIFVWLLVNFIRVLHEFHSLGMILIACFAAAIGLSMVASIMLAILGIGLPQEITNA